MKTKELVRRLNELDPSGEIECCVGNVDIFNLERGPSFWDGSLQILERDTSKDPYYNIIGAKRTNNGLKISLRTYSIEDYITDFPETANIDYSECSDLYKQFDDKWRQEVLSWNP